MAGIPVLQAFGSSIARTWESSLLKLYTGGIDLATQYDAPNDPPSKDCSMVMVVENPLAEPMIHKDMPGGLEDLQEYVMEVCDGIKDHWVRNPDDPNDKRWEYTYHNRLFNYEYNSTPKNWPHSTEITCVDQIAKLCEQLVECPYTRRAQAITWKVWEDQSCYDPPCLQSIWCRILPGETLYLNMNVRFRSRDAYKAAFMNMFALVMLQQRIALRISEKIGREVQLGRYMDVSDSYHIYGKNLLEFKSRFLKAMTERTFEERTMRYCDMKDIMDEAIPGILEKVKQH